MYTIFKWSYILACMTFLQINQSYAQEKEVIVDVRDSTWLKYYNEFVSKYPLEDLNTNRDSIYIRIVVNTISTRNSIYELKFKNNSWSYRVISFGSSKYYRYYISFLLFNKPRQLVSKRTKNLELLYERKIAPEYNDSLPDWNAVEKELLGLFNLRTEVEVNKSDLIVDDGVWYYIVLSTPSELRYIFWSNPKYASPSEDAEAIIRMGKLLDDVLLLDQESSWTIVKKKKW